MTRQSTKRLLLGSASVVALSFCTVSAAQAHDDLHKRYYVSVFGGWTDALDHKFAFVNNTTNAQFGYQVSYESGYNFGGAIGLVWNKNVRVELEISRISLDFGNNYASLGFTGLNEQGGVDMTAALMNVWFNTHVGSLMPYIGGGIGVGWIDGNLRVSNGAGLQFDGDDTGVVLQLGGGVRMPIGHNLELDLGYRLKHMPDINFASAINGFRTTESDFTTHSFQAGINWKF